MRVAWFRAAPAAPGFPADDTPSLVAELATTHDVEVYDERRAHDFPWQHARRTFDLCVYELSDAPSAAFIWPYLLHYPGLVRLRSLSPFRSRTRALQQEGRFDDANVELAFGPLRIPLLAGRLVVVADEHTAETIRLACPAARVRVAPLGVPAAGSAHSTDRDTPLFGVFDTTRLDAVERAAERAREMGSGFDLRFDATETLAVGECDAIVALAWPPRAEPPLAALAAMSAAHPAVVYEAGVTAAWPALDPQTWQPRGLLADGEPIVVSIDPRDEEHSLMLAFRRLAGDAALRRRLGAAARWWWQVNATPPVAATAWRPLLEEATSSQPPPKPADWPRHLTADGTERTRAMLAEIGVSVDFLDDFPQA